MRNWWNSDLMKLADRTDVQFWFVTNALAPVLVAIIFDISTLPWQVRVVFGHLTVGLILVANIWALWKFRQVRKWFGWTIFLNLFFYATMSTFTFITALPWIPWLFGQMYDNAVYYLSGT